MSRLFFFITGTPKRGHSSKVRQKKKCPTRELSHKKTPMRELILMTCAQILTWCRLSKTRQLQQTHFPPPKKTHLCVMTHLNVRVLGTPTMVRAGSPSPGSQKYEELYSANSAGCGVCVMKTKLSKLGEITLVNTLKFFRSLPWTSSNRRFAMNNRERKRIVVLGQQVRWWWNSLQIVGKSTLTEFLLRGELSLRNWEILSTARWVGCTKMRRVYTKLFVGYQIRPRGI